MYVDEKNYQKDETFLPSKIGNLSVSTFYTNKVIIAFKFNTLRLVTVN